MPSKINHFKIVDLKYDSFAYKHCACQKNQIDLRLHKIAEFKIGSSTKIIYRPVARYKTRPMIFTNMPPRTPYKRVLISFRPLSYKRPLTLTQDHPVWLKRPSTFAEPSTLRTIDFGPLRPSTLDQTYFKLSKLNWLMYNPFPNRHFFLVIVHQGRP